MEASNCANAYLLVCVFVVGLVALLGFFITKTKGFGRFATSTFLILLVAVISSLLYVGGKFEAQTMANIFFAVIGFAGGLFTRESATTDAEKPDKSKKGKDGSARDSGD